MFFEVQLDFSLWLEPVLIHIVVLTNETAVVGGVAQLVRAAES